MGINNPYLNGVLIGLADLVGFTFVYFYINHFSRKFFHRLHLFTIIISVAMLFFAGLIFGRKSLFAKILETIFSGRFISFNQNNDLSGVWLSLYLQF